MRFIREVILRLVLRERWYHTGGHTLGLVGQVLHDPAGIIYGGDAAQHQLLLAKAQFEPGRGDAHDVAIDWPHMQ